ncbi:MAG: carboxypeptidase regulatory-like domain-containing protein [Candidatus Electryonea clarkiae]|nr:carboxypeptidase regulatory-like domain-containing protein [Candidatus Electryonea clarkiae]
MKTSFKVTVLFLAVLFLIPVTLFAQIEFTRHVVGTNFAGVHRAYPVDIDGDGDMDVTGAAYSADAIGWWENDGDMGFEAHMITTNLNGANNVYAEDVDSDGDMDVLGSAGFADAIIWWENDGEEGFEEHTISNTFNYARSVCAVDIDSDGDMDVFAVADLGDDLSWWENDGEEGFEEQLIEGDLDYPIWCCAADVDSDGDPDLLTAAAAADDITWWENDGDGDFTEHVIDGDYDGAHFVNAGDLDSDGDTDVLGASGSGDLITWWENDGDQNFTEHVISDEIDGPGSVITADFDMDGDMDVGASSGDTDCAYWWENDGDQNFEEHLIADNLGRVFTIYAIDMDGDLDLDLVCAEFNAATISWLESDLDPDLDASVDGFITDAVTGDFIEDAIIRIGPGRDTTNVNGYYFIEETVSGNRIVSIFHENYTQFSEEVEIFVGENNMDFELFPLSPVSGRVTDFDTGDPIEGASIRFGIETTTTDDNGEWEVGPQEQGEITVRITADHYYDFEEIVEVEEDENFFEFEMLHLATIAGTITDSETEEPVEGAEISFGDTLYSAISDTDGIYSIEDVEAGAYDVSIVAEGYYEYTEDEIEIEEHENEIDFSIDILSGDLTGVVIDEVTAEPLFGATVTVTDPETDETYREVQTDEEGAYTAPSLHDEVRYLVSVTLENYAPSDTESVLIRWDRDNIQDFELTPIYTRGIRQLQTEQDLETWVTTTGIVTQGTNVTDSAHTDIYIQDDTNWGIQVWSDDPWDPENNINRGDEISVLGFLIEVEDITRIINIEIEVINTDQPLPDPMTESTGDMSENGQREGTWAQIMGQINSDPPGEGDFSLIVDDGSGQCEVRIIENTGIDLPGFSANDFATFTGVISMSRQGVRIVPNIQDDVVLLPFYPPSNLDNETEEIIINDTLRLVVTLYWEHDHLDDWLRFKIFRDDEHVGNTQNNTWSDTLTDPNPGEYENYSWIYNVTAVYDEGETDHSNDAEVRWWITYIHERPFSGIPTEWAIETIYPNPFNPLLSVVIALPEISDLHVGIYNLLGQQVGMIADGVYEAGYMKFSFDGINLTSGIYFIHASVPGKLNDVRKIVLMK